MELLAHGCDAAACDGLLAAGAQGAAPLVVVRLAIGLAVVIKEAAVDEWCETLLKESEKDAEFRAMGYERSAGALVCIQVAHPADEAFRMPQ